MAKTVEELQAELDKLKTNRDEILAEKKALATKLSDTEGRLTKLEKGALDAEGDIEKVRADAEKRANDAIAAAEKKAADAADAATKRIEGLEASLVKATVDSDAKAISGELALQGYAETLEPHVRLNMKANIAEDGTVKTEYRDAEGALVNRDAYVAGIKANKAFDRLLAGTQGGGGGNPPGDNDGGNPPANGSSMKQADFAAMSADQRAAFFNSKEGQGIQSIEPA